MFVVAGESLIDLVAKPDASGGTMEFSAHAGGSPYNCARALALLGGDTGFLCPISVDTFGDTLMGPLDAAGVRVLLETRSAKPTTLAVVTRNARGLPSYSFYRQGTAERDLSPDALDAALPAAPTVFQIGGFAPIEPDDFSVWEAVAREAARRGALISIDPNVRPSLINDFAGYKTRLSALLDLAHIIKVSDEDLEALDPQMSIAQHVDALLARPHCALVVVTLGAEGARGFTRAGAAQAPVHTPPQFGDTVGAGDSLMAGLLTAVADRGLLAPERLAALESEEIAAILRFGTVVAGLNCAHVGCHPPRRAEVEAVLERIS